MSEEDNYHLTNESKSYTTETAEEEEDTNNASGYIRQDVLKIINDAKVLGALSIDLSQKNLASIPSELYDLEQIEYLYLEGNMLDSAPVELFERLPNLKWLDLRYNKLTSLSTSCRKQRSLKTLLLEDNCLTELPSELGLVKTLTGLNLRNNPLQFPPSRILAKGVKEILGYLRDSLTIKEQKLKPSDLRIEDLNLDGSLTHSSESDSDYISRRHHQLDGQEKSHLGTSLSPGRQSTFSVASNASDLEFPRPQSVSLHRHMTYEEYRQLQYEKFKRAGALGVLGREKRRRRYKKQETKHSAPVYSIDPIEAQFMEEKRLERLKRLKRRQTVMEQRVKDQRLLEDWRDESKEMQRKHYIRAVKHGKTDFADPLKVPYDMDPEYLQILSKEERIKKEVKTQHEKERGKTGQQQTDKAKLERDRQLMEKIKQHTQKVQERKIKPKGNPQEEMEAAKQDLEMASQLQRQVNQRAKDLEYRFRAFTGDASPNIPLPTLPYKT